MPQGGLEPRRVAPYAPQTYVSTSSTTSALGCDSALLKLRAASLSVTAGLLLLFGNGLRYIRRLVTVAVRWLGWSRRGLTGRRRGLVRRRSRNNWRRCGFSRSDSLAQRLLIEQSR